jgi:hypothetical protein
VTRRKPNEQTVECRIAREDEAGKVDREGSHKTSAKNVCQRKLRRKKGSEARGAEYIYAQGFPEESLNLSSSDLAGASQIGDLTLSNEAKSPRDKAECLFTADRMEAWQRLGVAASKCRVCVSRARQM